MSVPQSQAARWPRRVALLGSTGSIGQSALDVIARMPDRLIPFALTANGNADLLAQQILEFRPEVAAFARIDLEARLRQQLEGRWNGTLLIGPKAVEEVAELAEADVVLNGLVGAAGLRPSLAALRAGKTLALANKESLVVAGALLTEAARRHGGTFLPVDSEHWGLFQLLDGKPREAVERVVITASGGPFRTRDLGSFGEIRPQEALRHPTWEMGPRITIDSATLLNKGFEVMEAHWLFGLDASRIDVWIHPQSVVHGLVHWVDGTSTAQLSVADMRIPIQSALCYPEKVAAPEPRCDLPRYGRLEFEEPDPRRYPCLNLARRALAEGGTAPAVLNAADEVLVRVFLDGGIRFSQIPELLARVLDQRPRTEAEDLDALMEADAWARREAAAVLVPGH